MTARRAELASEGQARLEEIYERVRRSFVENLTTIDEATCQLATGTLHETERREAESAAHRLAGTAAMVGFPRATAHAQRLERAFAWGELGSDNVGLVQAEVEALRRILRVPRHRSC